MTAIDLKKYSFSILTSLILLFVVLSLFSFSISAQTKPEVTSTGIPSKSISYISEIKNMTKEQRAEKIDQLKSLRRLVRCKIIEENTNNRLVATSDSQQQSTNRINGLVSKVEDLIKDYEGSDIDTEAIQVSLDKIAEINTEISDSMDKFSITMQKISSVACEIDPKNKIVDYVSDAKEIHTFIKYQLKQIKEIITDDLIPDLKLMTRDIKRHNKTPNN